MLERADSKSECSPVVFVLGQTSSIEVTRSRFIVHHTEDPDFESKEKQNVLGNNYITEMLTSLHKLLEEQYVRTF